jgi:flagellar hook-associated protein 1 FlgK
VSLSSALNSAVTGLSVTSKRAAVVADNVANADRPGYARRSLSVASPAAGLPAHRTAIERSDDPRLTALRRDSEARAAHASVAQSFQTRLDAGFGDPDQPGSLQDRLAALDAALVTASTNPHSEVALRGVAETAGDLAGKLNGLHDIVVGEREAADAEIGSIVQQLNDDLGEVARLNGRIIRGGPPDAATADLLDRRDLLIDRISEAVPVRLLPRDGGAVALVSQQGQMLLDGRPVEIAFTPQAPITPDMAFPGRLSGLEVNGRPLTSHGDASVIGGGKLSALFELRDDLAPEATARLDGLALELIDRFADPATDPTLMAGEQGLFVDPAATGDPGLAGRIARTPLVSPDAPATLAALTEGLGSAPPVPGDDLLAGMAKALSRVDLPISGALSQTSGDMAGILADLRSAVSRDRARSEERSETLAFEVQSRQDLKDGAGVDIDGEMRRLLEIEQNYAANARVVQVAGNMLDRLTEL